MDKATPAWGSWEEKFKSLLNTAPKRQSSQLRPIPLEQVLQSLPTSGWAGISKLLQTKMATAVTLSPTNIFEHFILVGQSNPKGGPEVIFQYPPENQTPLMFPFSKFCFPRGIRIHDQGYVVKSGPLSAWHQDHPLNSFSFTLSINNENVYLICVQDDHLDPVPTFVPRGKSGSAPKNLKRARCWCFISYYPFTDFLFNILYRLLDAEQANQKNPVKSEDKNPVLMILSHLFHAPPPKPGVTQDYAFVDLSYKFPSDTKQVLFQHGVAILFHILYQDKVFALMSSILLDQRVLILSKNIKLLYWIALALTQLIRPFTTQAVVIPVVPDDLLTEIINVDIPYIFGCSNPPFIADMKIPSDLVVVDLDQRDLWSGKALAPDIPQKDFLGATLVTFSSHLHNRPDIPWGLTEFEKTYADAITHTIHHILSSYFIEFQRHCFAEVEHRRVSFLYDSFFASTEAKTDLQFFKKFFKSEVWKYYSTTKLKKAELALPVRATFVPPSSPRNSPRSPSKRPSSTDIKSPAGAAGSATPGKAAVSVEPARKTVARKLSFVAIDLSTATPPESDVTSESTSEESSTTHSSDEIEI